MTHLIWHSAVHAATLPFWDSNSPCPPPPSLFLLWLSSGCTASRFQVDPAPALGSITRVAGENSLPRPLLRLLPPQSDAGTAKSLPESAADLQASAPPAALGCGEFPPQCPR